ncbi:phosphatidylglycerol:prolipoprotein diacylglycerol transferase [Rhodoligotrophos appendicifer]|uniref:prolipoprotein diacylglyceryl transferase n=1 Tax=Rhodoligotrophos appendicifer TaxID=987056 RepID=UPI0011862557|nr:prolipoprotein diacylglyceryl transferase [Rhodoligotrophos appendicifer]
MPLYAIPFPAIDPVIFAVGPFAIRWYALAYIVGLLFGWWYVRRLVSSQSLWTGAAPLTPTDIDDLFLWAALGVILGGRAGYVLFYNFPSFMANPTEIFKVWHGGMSFHGGFLGVIVAVVAFGWRRKVSGFTMLDLAAAGTPIGLLLGRIANFINGELYGRVTDVAWGVVFPTDPEQVPRHPSQLYEGMLEGLILFTAIVWLIHRRKALARPGLVAGVFTFGYGLVRIFVEFFRMPDVQIGFLAGGLTMGMLLSVPMLVVGLWLILRAKALPTVPVAR